ncbi:MAG: hypothetical protein M3144_06680, partial [Actinomycetota bacterium]|nr:hypothetical protein [Actinomycetota bacterium]
MVALLAPLALALGLVGISDRTAFGLVAPANDAFAAAHELSGPQGTVEGTSEGATRELDEPQHAEFLDEAGDASVWYRWTAPADANATFTLEPLFQGVLAVYTGKELATLERVPGPISETEAPFTATAGVTYQVAVAGLKGGSGSFNLTWTTRSVTPPPPSTPRNDNLSGAVPLSDWQGRVIGTNVGATLEPGEPHHSSPDGPTNGASVWWSWTAAGGGEVTLTTAESGFDTVLAVFGGPSFDSLLAVNDDIAGAVTSSVSIPAQAGRTYYVQVLGRAAATGAVVLSWNQTFSAPSNDDLADAASIEGAAGVVSGSNMAATSEPGEPLHGGVGVGVSAWWRWTAPADAAVTFSTLGSR